MYESPISLYMEHVFDDIKREQEEYVMKAVQNVHIDVDREELLKALNYDRKQYEKGYCDGYDAGVAQTIERVRNGEIL